MSFFALLMPRIFLKRDAILRQLGHDTASHTLPWDGNRSLDPCDLSEGTLEVAEITWADDVAIPRQCASAADVAQGLRGRHHGIDRSLLCVRLYSLLWGA